MEVTRELVELACVSGLAKRALFDLLGPYCNADCFIWYGQRFDSKLDYAGMVDGDEREKPGTSFT